MAGRHLAPNPAGAHFLRDRRLTAQLARDSGAREGQLAVDLGAGGGAITAELAATGARVIAVERDGRLAARLRRRFEHQDLVTVVEADLRSMPLPRQPFLVVSSPPFSLTTALCRRLLGDPAVPLAGAELIIERGAARRLAASRPRDAETAWWMARYQARLIRVVGPGSFVPPPRAHAAWLTLRRRPGLLSARGQRQLRAVLASAYRRPGDRVDRVVALPRRLLLTAGLEPTAPVADITADQWHRLAMRLDGGTTRPGS